MIKVKAMEAIEIRRNLGNVMVQEREQLIRNAIWKECPDKQSEMLMRYAPSEISQAEIVLWTKDMYDAAIRGANDAFTGTTIPESILEKPVIQIWYLTDCTVGFQGGAEFFELPVTSVCDCLILLPVTIADGPEDRPTAIVGIYLFIDSATMQIHLRASYPMMVGGKIAYSHITFLALHGFMNLKLTAVNKIRLPRQAERRMGREKIAIPEISIVQLRKREQSERQAESNREYHHRWIVKGHWRKLHRPRKDGAQTTYVDAYVKGPEGMPLLPHKDSIFAVTR